MRMSSLLPNRLGNAIVYNPNKCSAKLQNVVPTILK